MQEYLKPPLQGFTLVDGEYAALPVESDGGIISRELGLKLSRDETVLRLFDLASGREVVRTEDLSDVLQQILARVQQAEEQAQREADARRLAEEQAQREADARRLAEEQAQREADARRRAEAEIERLRAELQRLRGDV